VLFSEAGSRSISNVIARVSPLLAAGIVFCFYCASALPGGFYYDDLILLSTRSVSDFSPLDFVRYSLARPLTLLTYHTDLLVADESAWWFHLVNIGIHCLNVALVGVVASRWTQNRIAGFWCALLFGTHFLVTEPANYVWARGVLLSSFFVLSGLLLLPRRQRLSWRSTTALAVVLIAGLLARPDAILLIPLGFLCRGLLQKVWWERAYLWFALILVLATAVVMYLLITSAERSMGFDLYDWGQWLNMSLAALFKYCELLVRPDRTSIFHPSPFLGPDLLLGAGVVAALILLLFLKRKDRLFLLGGLSFFTVIAFSITIPITESVGERRMYLSIFGLCLAISAWLFPSMKGETAPSASPSIRPVRRHVRHIGAMIVLVGVLPAAWWRNNQWSTPPRIWWAAERVYPGSAKVQFMLATHFNSSDNTRSQIYYRNCIRRDASYPSVHNNLGNLYAREGRLDEAEREYHEELRHHPQSALVLNNLGVLFIRRGRLDTGMDYFRKALSVEPGYGPALENLRKAGIQR